ncbi:PREDICTED: tRNA (adenine(37)-N6)-methyltransferase [Nanorana parkeri]|uniref:tRNA (adenine(37)-N6)-methyltransferase n=1 Tax=Nanorana parkeri TaxID=125878 RepID=UPI000854F8EC|nr:PREDICTED: tRNA (adenine(37)-N6)-methyltransferase [Nanorana parkeri]
MALAKGDFNLLRNLVESGTDINIQDKEVRTALINCCLHDGEKWALGSARLLLTYGAKVGLCDKVGRNALMYAIMYGRQYLVKLFLDALDYDLDHTDKLHHTALWYAAHCGNTNITTMVTKSIVSDFYAALRLQLTPVREIQLNIRVTSMENKRCEKCQEKRDAALITSSLETGHLLTKPIGYIESCFAEKNGTPRQPSVCSLSRGCLKISKSVFNNPEHSVMDLQQFSHVWILFIFHKNGRLSCKAKVQPPRLNGAKTGVFSTRSPHRPNAIGLTLAKLEKVEGGTLYLSGIDMIQGTPVIDIKPYISEYDSPRATHSFVEEPEENKKKHEGSDDSSEHQQETSPKEFNIICHGVENKMEDKAEISSSHDEILNDHKENVASETIVGTTLPVEDSCSLQEYSSRQIGKDLSVLDKRTELTHQVNTGIKDNEDRARTCDSFVATWVTESPVPKLKVRFTQHAEMELKQFEATCDSGGPCFRYFKSFEEAKCAISTVLSADPRSVYRRNRCLDRLFYFSLDTMHLTCWFGDGFAEVVRIQPVSQA